MGFGGAFHVGHPTHEFGYVIGQCLQGLARGHPGGDAGGARREAGQAFLPVGREPPRHHPVEFGGPLGVGVSVAFPQLPPGLVGLGALGDLGAPGGIHLLGISKGWWGQCNKPRAIAAYCGPTGEPCER